MIYAVRQWVSEQDKMESRTHAWKVATDGNSPARQITFGEKGESQAQFSPDGKFISFVAARGGADAKSQIHVMSIEGGEAWKLTDSKENVSSYSWSPDGSRIAFVATDPRSAAEEADIKKRDDERVFEGDFRFAHAWVIDINTKEARRVTEGQQWTVQGAPSWSPDGKQLVFGAATTPMLRDNRRDVYVATLAPASGPAGQQVSKIEKISTNWGNDGSPRWSQDGATIAWVGEPNTTSALPDGTAHGVVMQQRLMLYDVKAKTIKDTLTPAFDSEAGNPVWTNEGKRVMFVTGKRAYNEAFVYDLDLGHLHSALAEAHDQWHVDQQGRSHHRSDDGCAGLGGGDLRHRSVVRQLQAVDKHQPATGRGPARRDRSRHLEEQ